jgi:hypothetical protein
VVDTSEGRIGQPTETANVTPINDVSDRTRQVIDAVRIEVNKDRISDSRWYLGIFGIGFLTLAGLFISGYLLLAAKIERLADKLEPVDRTTTRIEQTLDDLIARRPPNPTPPRL